MVRRKFVPCFLLCLVLGGLHAAWAQGEPAWPSNDGLFDLGPMVEDGAPEGPGSQAFLRAAGSNFAPRDRTTTFSYYGGGCMQRTSNAGDSWFTWDVQVPDGAVIDFLRVYYYDNNATFDINAELWSFDAGGGSSLIAEADSSGSPGYSSAGSDFFSHPVSTVNESLVVVASVQGGVGSSLALCGVRLRYQVP
ncbi:MAG: hypothetical protein DWQ36_09250 [Acidobacteria bacterium]|nr:MAG: hypothetical protein DWQ30_22495 [Acidobacteriota bacterium]REK08546.1 MAG: hypothetical protein DWQ36_09250 [Acidobacteriota bacterium]